MPVYAEKICDMLTLLKYAEKEKCGNMWNMWQSHIRIKVTCLPDNYFYNVTYLLCLQCFDAVIGRQEGIRPVKNLSGGVLAWLSVWSEVQTCIRPSWCHCHSLSLASVKSRLVLPFWYWLTWVVPEKGPLNRCVCVYLLTWQLWLTEGDEHDGHRKDECLSDRIGIWTAETYFYLYTRVCFWEPNTIQRWSQDISYIKKIWKYS